MKLSDIIKIFQTAQRIGRDKDFPEGVRYIQISDTLAIEIEEELINIEGGSK